jgi:hypothetical protein
MGLPCNPDVIILSATALLAIAGLASAQRNAEAPLTSGRVVRAQMCSDPVYVQGGSAPGTRLP